MERSWTWIQVQQVNKVKGQRRGVRRDGGELEGKVDMEEKSRVRSRQVLAKESR